MSREDAEAVRGAFEAMGTLGPDPSAEAVAKFAERWFEPDAEYVEDPSWPGAGIYQGRDQVSGAFDGYREVLTASTVNVEEVVEADETVVALVRIAGESETGLGFDNLWGYLCRVRNGRLSYFRAYLDKDEALEAAGVTAR
jgi:ketosteroid isomerase-like protein